MAEILIGNCHNREFVPIEIVILSLDVMDDDDAVGYISVRLNHAI